MIDGKMAWDYAGVLAAYGWRWDDILAGNRYKNKILYQLESEMHTASAIAEFTVVCWRTATGAAAAHAE